jgi:hypothetical protein
MALCKQGGLDIIVIRFVADHGMLESIDQPLPVRIIANDFLPTISPCQNVIDGTLEFDSKSSWHARSLRGEVCQREEPKSVTAKHPRSSAFFERA